MSKAIEINNERLECVNHFGKKEYVEWNCLKMGNPSLTGWLFKNLKNKLTIISILNFSSKDRRKINNAIKYLLTLNGLKKRGRINNVYIKV
ncbi:MAG: hypothetical protein GX638_12355 [Crenarchaeota archaeon]|nr:hypothetical protein [Thermoproteota archaeon]